MYPLIPYVQYLHRASHDRADIEDVKIGGRNITNPRYADNTDLLANDLTTMKIILYMVDAFMKVLRKPRAKSASGPNGVTNIVYKRGPKVARQLWLYSKEM